MITDTTEADLLANILANPADDLPRLVYADWLEEQPGQVACTVCFRGEQFWSDGDGSRYEPCLYCHGTGRVPNPARPAERAEFIRVQCELNKRMRPVRVTPSVRPTGPGLWRVATGLHFYHGDDYDALRRRERELLEGPIRFDLREGYWAAQSKGFNADGTLLSIFPPGGGPQIGTGRASRGFVSTVRLPLGVFLKLASLLFRAHPIERVEVSDQDPYQLSAGEWLWRLDGQYPFGMPVEPHGFFPTRQAALDALSAALVGHGRRAAKEGNK